MGSKIKHRFSLDQQSFERFVAAASQYQSLQLAYAKRSTSDNSALSVYLLETLRAIDAEAISSRAALERVVSLAQRITGAEGAGVWLVTPSGMTCKAITGTDFDTDLTRHALWARLWAVDDRDTVSAANEAVELGVKSAPPIMECANSESSPSLLIAPLPEETFSGALAIFSHQANAFGRNDNANLKLLASLVKYILEKSYEPLLLDDLYVPGLGTRAALAGDAQDDSHFAWQEHASRFVSTGRSLVSGLSRGLARATNAVNQDSAKTVTYLKKGWRRTRHVGRYLRELTLAKARSVVSGVSLSTLPGVARTRLGMISRFPQASVNRMPWRFRRLRFHTRKLLVDTHALISSRWDASPVDRSGLLVQLHYVSWQRCFRFLERNRNRVAWLRQFGSSASLKFKRAIGTLLSNSVHTRETLAELICDVHVEWPALKRLGSPGMVLAIMVVFVGMLAREQHRATPSLLPGTKATISGSSTQMFAANVLSSAVSALPHPQPKNQVLPVSHGQITDRETMIALAEMSPYELRTLRRAAEYGDDEAAWELGMLYELGKEVPQSCPRAAEWVKKAALLGNAAAEYNLGLRYREGDGVQISIEEAEHWLRKAQLHNDPAARRVLALLLAEDQPTR